MTVQRQYTLPYCNLILEGIEAVATDPYSPMTVLMNAECQFPGVTDTTLTGGREFLESLVAAVSAYGQHLLSGIARPASATPPLVDIKPGEGDYHYLLVRQQPTGEPIPDTEALAPLEIRLTTVQFYDLMEAVDQLLADSQTLPDLTAQFQAISRRLVKPAEPIAQRSAPAVVGAVALAAAGLALFLVPPPQFEPSQLERRRETTENVAPNESPAADADSVDPWEAAPAITDAETLDQLQQGLQEQLQDDWAAEPLPSEDWIYRVVVSEAGDIVGYKYENDAALDAVSSTPLAQVTVPTIEADAPQQAVAQFLARFTPAGLVEVEPWDSTLATDTDRPTPEEAQPNEDDADRPADSADRDATDQDEDTQTEADSEPATDTERPALTTSTEPQTLETLEQKITDGDRIRTLNQDLRAQLSEADLPNPSSDLIYQVRLDDEGNVVAYEAINTDALLLAEETPLPTLVAPRAASDDLADFRVVFTAKGVIEVSPWDGWPR